MLERSGFRSQDVELVRNTSGLACFHVDTEKEVQDSAPPGIMICLSKLFGGKGIRAHFRFGVWGTEGIERLNCQDCGVLHCVRVS